MFLANHGTTSICTQIHNLVSMGSPQALASQNPYSWCVTSTESTYRLKNLHPLGPSRIFDRTVITELLYSYVLPRQLTFAHSQRSNTDIPLLRYTLLTKAAGWGIPEVLLLCWNAPPSNLINFEYSDNQIFYFQSLNLKHLLWNTVSSSCHQIEDSR